MRLSFQFNNLLGTVYRQGNLVFSADGNMLYAAVGNRVSAFDLVRSRTFTFPFEARRNISRLALSPDGAILLCVDDEGHLLMANVLRRVVVHHLNLKEPVRELRFSPDVRAAPAHDSRRPLRTTASRRLTRVGLGVCRAWSAGPLGCLRRRPLCAAVGDADARALLHTVCPPQEARRPW
jgi:hypothetical protein